MPNKSRFSLTSAKIFIENAPEDEDPFKSYGFGIIAYHKLLYSLVSTFFVISLLVSINLYIFNEGNGLPSDSKGQWAYQYTLGNLGFSRSNCIIQYLSLNNPSKF
jgi:hypothetical protein